MLKLALGIAVLLQAGSLRAEPEEPGAEAAVNVDVEEEGSAVHVGCPANEGGRAASRPPDCVAEQVVVPAPAAIAVGAPANAPAPSAQATVSFRNDVGGRFRLVEARFTMDGTALPTVLTGGERGKSYVIFGGAVLPGPHVVTARLTYQGERRVFTYMKGYKLNVTSNQVLTAPADRNVSFTLVSAENQGLNVPLERRVVVRVEEGAAR